MNYRIKINAPEILNDVLKRVPHGISDLKLPKEVLSAVVANIEKVRGGALDAFSTEVARALAKVDVRTVVHEVLRNYTFKVNAEISLEPKNKVKAKKRGKRRE